MASEYLAPPPSEPEDLIQLLPSWAREDPDFGAVVDCAARESARMRDRLGLVRDQLIPWRAGELGLPWWEAFLGASPKGKTVQERREEVAARLAAAVPDSRGSTWEAQVTERIGSAWDYVEDAAAFTLTISVPHAPPLDWIEVLLRPVTPAHLDIVMVSGEGFLLDNSQLDQEQFHAS